MEETAFKPESYTPNPHAAFREGGGEEVALKRRDGDRRAGVGGRGFSRSKSTAVRGDLRVLWGLARSKIPEMEPKAGSFFFLKLPGDSTVQPRVRTRGEGLRGGERGQTER